MIDARIDDGTVEAKADFTQDRTAPGATACPELNPVMANPSSMELIVIGLVLIAAIMHAVWNALLKAASDQFIAITLVNLMCGALSFAVLPFIGLPDRASWPFLAGSAAIHQFYFLFLTWAYRHGDLSHVYPISRGAGPLLVVMASSASLGEELTWSQQVGSILTSLGILSLAAGGSDLLRARNLVALGLALGTGVTIAAYTINDALGVRASGAPVSYVATLFALNGVCFLPWLLLKRATPLMPAFLANWRFGLFGSILATGAYGIVLWCFSVGAVAPIAALRETSVIFAAIIGAKLLHEPFGHRRVAASAIVTAGVVVMNLRF